MWFKCFKWLKKHANTNDTNYTSYSNDTDDANEMIRYKWYNTNDMIQMVQYKWYDTKDTIQIIQIKWYYKNNSSENKWVTNSIEEFAISRLKQTKADIFDAKVSQHL